MESTVNNNNNQNFNQDDEKGKDFSDDDGPIEKKEYDYVHDFVWSEELENNANKILEENQEVIISDNLDTQLKNWEKFYKFNKTNFFKDRHYILAEFQELEKDTRNPITLLDIGCGVGNSFYPLVKRLPNLIVYAFDFSQRAVNMAKTHKLYDDKRIHLTHLDVVEDEISFPSCDYGILMFVLSAVKPENHKKVLLKIAEKINKGGILYFRDYARYDLAQLRFASRKKNKVGDNLYMRKDKTLSYFFDKKEIEELFEQCGFKILVSNLICRLIENRKDNKKMHRLWLQMKLIKI